MDKLREIYQAYNEKRISPVDALNEIRKTYLLREEELALSGLTIEHFDYNTYQLKQNGEFQCESDEASCYEIASKIIFK